MGLGSTPDPKAGTNAGFRGFGGASGEKKKTPKPWLRVLYWSLVLSGIYFAYLNIAPYAKAVEFLGGKNVNRAFIYLVSVIPIVNGIAAVIGRGITWIIGAVLWLVIQLIELLPIILYSHDGFMQEIITSADSRSKYQVKDNDDPTLSMLKNVYNKLPISVITNLERLKIATYTIDFLICITVYSPVASGKFSDFFWVVATGQWGKLDYGNLVLAIITLFAIEVIVTLILWVGRLSQSISRGSRK